MEYKKLPKDNQNQKYIRRTKCCIAKFFRIGVPQRFVCSQCYTEISEKNIVTFTELKQ